MKQAFSPATTLYESAALPFVIKITGTELARTLDAGSPRIQFDESSGTRPDYMESSLTIMPYMMMPGHAQWSATRES